MKARVLYGINDLFNVDVEGVKHQVRIKGKQLKTEDKTANVLSPGDWVMLNSEYQIIQRLPRINTFARYNLKNSQVQTLAANIDYVFCVLSYDKPEFRQSLLDRFLVASVSANITPWIIITKSDLNLDGKHDNIFKMYKNMGYPIYLTSTDNSDTFTDLKKTTAGKIVALVGASGVGKSTLINNLLEENIQKVGCINRKFYLGNHTTNYSIILPRTEGGYWIDTPGMRDFSPVITQSLDKCFVEFEPYLTSCAYKNCKHLEEPNCAIKNAVTNSYIQKSRYAIYCRLLTDELRKISKKRF